MKDRITPLNGASFLFRLTNCTQAVRFLQQVTYSVRSSGKRK